MTAPAQVLALLLVDGHVASFARQAPARWRHDPLHGEDWYALNGADALARVLDELDARLNQSDQLAGFMLHLICEQAALPWLADVGRALAARRCSRWQVLQWDPLRDRATRLGGHAPAMPLPARDWLLQRLLPVLEATFDYQDEALAAERLRAEQQHTETLESLRADRLRLEAEIATQREQIVALNRPALDDLLTYMPAIYRNLFGAISPQDLALLAGSLQPPQVASPWPEPSPDTLHVLQSRLRKLPPQHAARLRDFCRQLPHPLELRAEMRAWLGEDR